MAVNADKVRGILMILMVSVSFTNLFGIRAAGISVFIGIIGFFTIKALRRQAYADSGLDFRSIGRNLKEGPIWFWMAMPLFTNMASIALSKLYLPGYIDHVSARTRAFVSLEDASLLLLQLAVLALGEEIAWRGFFQRELQKGLPVMTAIIITSALFALGHAASGSLATVAYDIFFVFVNSVFYGILFYKTDNAWMSAVPHLAANLLGVSILVFF